MEIITIPILRGMLPQFLGAICYEGDKNEKRVEFTGAEPGLQYKLDLERTDGMKNVLDLINQNGTLVLPLDGSVHIPEGRYHAQLRTVGDVVRHSNKALLTVLDAINAQDAFEAVLPTEMAQLEQRVTEVAAHPPVPGENGFWLLWDAADKAYKESGVPATVGAPGADGRTPVRGEDYWTEEDKSAMVTDVLAALTRAEEVRF